IAPAAAGPISTTFCESSTPRTGRNRCVEPETRLARGPAIRARKPLRGLRPALRKAGRRARHTSEGAARARAGGAQARERAASPRGKGGPPRARALRRSLAVAEGAALAPPEPSVHARLRREPLHGLDGARGRSSLRRRRGRRLRPGEVP